MSHAPHKVHTVFVNNTTGAFVPEGVDKLLLRAETFSLTEPLNSKITLTLSDFYADEYRIGLGPASDSMLRFAERLTTEKTFCVIKAHLVQPKTGPSFTRPVVKTTTATAFKY